MSDKEKIFSYLYRSEFTESIINFDQILLDASRRILGRAEDEAEIYAARNAKRLWNEFHKRLEEDQKRGLKPFFVVVDASARKLKWYPAGKHHGDDSEKTQKSRLAARPHLLKTIDLFTWREYEALGCTLCRILGSPDTKLTPGGGDAGIDFFAILDLESNSHIFSSPVSNLRVIGQSKKHSSKIPVGNVDRFMTNIEEVRHHSPSILPELPTWFRVKQGPIVGWMISHVEFQSGASSKAKRHGIILSDSIDLAEVASLSDRIDRGEGPGKRANIFKRLVREEL